MDCCPLPKVSVKKIRKNVSKKLSSNYCEKLLSHSKQFATDACKSISKRSIEKTAGKAGNKITSNKVSRTSPHYEIA